MGQGRFLPHHLKMANGKTVTCAYAAMDRMISVKGVEGVTTAYIYDALGCRPRRRRQSGPKNHNTPLLR